MTVRDVATGWPSKVLVRTDSGSQRVALHVSQASPHSREKWEWRFQNPASAHPVCAPGESMPLLVGRDTIDGRDVLVVVDGRSRVGRSTRFSILFNKRICREAAACGWSEQVSSSGEHIFAVWPKLLPLVIEILCAGVEIAPSTVAAAAEAAGLLNDDSDQAGERARRTVSVYVRGAKFGGSVKEAYEYRCAMCEVGLGLLAGAHILPVSAPGAPDKVWNGMALCHNHHAAFDAHQLWIASNYAIHQSPRLSEAARGSKASSLFLEQTRATLLLPAAKKHRPKRDMFKRRYEYYVDQYGWAPTF